jgi:hypothetical protein
MHRTTSANHGGGFRIGTDGPFLRTTDTAGMAPTAHDYCTLRAVVGTPDYCPHEGCAFWEKGGAVVERGCAVERLGLDQGARSNPQLAVWLLELRERLESASSHAERRAAYRAFHELVPPELRD